METSEAIEVLKTYRESAVVERDRAGTPGRERYWQDRIDALDAAIQTLEDARWRED